MYRICFNGVTFATTQDEKTAISIAVNLHSASNVEHKVDVFLNDDLIIHLYAASSGKE